MGLLTDQFERKNSRMTDDEDVFRIALTLPEATAEGSGFGIRGKGFAWFYQEKVEGVKGRVERRDVLAVRVPNADAKEFLLMAAPDKFFTVPHYNGYPAVLVRLPAIDTDELTDLLREAWRIQAPKKWVAAFDADSGNEVHQTNQKA